MKIKSAYVYWLIIIILSVLLFLQRSCQKPCPKLQIDTIFTTHYDTIRDSFFIKQPVPYQVIHRDTFFQWNDEICNQYIDAYFSQNIYLDTLLNDSNNLIAVRDTIMANMIQGRKLYFTSRNKTITQTITNIVGDTMPRRNKLFIGFTFGGIIDKPDAGLSLMLLTKKDMGYSLSYFPITRSYYGSFFYKLRLRKK